MALRFPTLAACASALHAKHVCAAFDAPAFHKRTQHEAVCSTCSEVYGQVKPSTKNNNNNNNNNNKTASPKVKSTNQFLWITTAPRFPSPLVTRCSSPKVSRKSVLLLKSESSACAFEIFEIELSSLFMKIC